MFTTQANILAIFITIIALSSRALEDDAADSIAQLTTSAVGNPFVGGPWHFPACGRNFPEKLPVWVFAVNVQYNSKVKLSVSLSVFSSSDMFNWELHDNVLDMSGFPWANATLRSPTPVYRNDKYYLYFSATGYPPEAAASERTVGKYSGIGVAVSDKPEGPYKNPLPHNTALIPADDPTITNPYGPNVLVDGDRAYMYHGATGSLEVRGLNDDMTSFSKEEGQKVTASPGHYEGIRIFKKDRNYYLLWNDVPILSQGTAGSAVASRHIRYAVSTNKDGPFQGGGFALSADPAIAHTVHHGEAMSPTKDTWFLLYSGTQTIPGYNNDTIDGLAFERMFFGPDGEYKLNKNNLPIGVFSNNSISVKPDPDDSKLRSYLQVDGTGTPEVVHAMTYTAFADFGLAVQVLFDKEADEHSFSGAIFRASAADNFEKWSGYLAERYANGTLALSKISSPGGTGALTWLASNNSVRSEKDPTSKGKKEGSKPESFYFKVRAEGSSIKVYGLGATYDEPAIVVDDKTWSVGWIGLRAHRMLGKFSSVEVTKIRSVVQYGFVLSGSDKGNPW